MDFISLLDNRELKPYQKRFKLGDYLFKQGDPGDAMYIVLDGQVKLVFENEDEKHVAAIIERGQFFGERAILDSTTTRRWCSAVAKSHVLALRITSEDFAAIKATQPDLAFDLVTHAFRETSARLETSNALNRALRSSDNLERVIALTVFLGRTQGTPVIEGREVSITPDSYLAHIDISREAAEACLTVLAENKAIVKKVNTTYVIPSEEKLEAFGREQFRELAQAAIDGIPADEQPKAGLLGRMFGGGRR